MQNIDDENCTMTLQQKAQFVFQKMQEGDLRAEWFFDQLSKRLNITVEQAMQATITTAFFGGGM